MHRCVTDIAELFNFSCSRKNDTIETPEMGDTKNVRLFNLFYFKTLTLIHLCLALAIVLTNFMNELYNMSYHISELMLLSIVKLLNIE